MVEHGLSRWNQVPPSANLTVELLRYKLGLPVAAPYTLTDMADDGLRLMDALGVRQFHVLGVSMGGMIAQHLAAMAPERVRSLTLIMSSSGAAGLPAPAPALVQLLARRSAPNREVAIEQQADFGDVGDQFAQVLHGGGTGGKISAAGSC